MAVDGSITISTKLDSAPITQALEKLKSSIAKVGQLLSNTGRPAQTAAQTMSKAYEQAKLKVEETERALNRLDEKRDAIASAKREELGFMPFTKAGLDEAVEKSLASDKEYNKLGTQIEKTEAKLESYLAKMN